MFRIARVMMTVVLLTIPVAVATESKSVDGRPGYLGFGFTYDTNPTNVSAPSWLTVRYVVPASPAERAGLKPGDLIIEIDGKALHFADSLDLVLALGKVPVDQPMKLTILRNRRRQSAEIIPSRMPDPQYEQWKTNLVMLTALRAQKQRQSTKIPPRP